MEGAFDVSAALMTSMHCFYSVGMVGFGEMCCRGLLFNAGYRTPMLNGIATVLGIILNYF